MIDHEIQVEVKEYGGLPSSLEGVGLYQDSKDAYKTAHSLGDRDHGENKHLESMMVWLKIRAPKYFWADFATYRFTTCMSERTYKTFMWFRKCGNDDEDLYKAQNMFECGDLYESEFVELRLRARNDILFSGHTKSESYCLFQKKCSTGHMLTKVVKIDCKTLREIFIQRINHITPHWRTLMRSIIEQIDPKYIDLMRVEKQIKILEGELNGETSNP